jgi:hypothetical protein
MFRNGAYVTQSTKRKYNLKIELTQEILDVITELK